MEGLVIRLPNTNLLQYHTISLKIHKKTQYLQHCHVKPPCCNWLKATEARLVAESQHCWQAWLDRGTKMRFSKLQLCHSCGCTLSCGYFSRTMPPVRVAPAFQDDSYPKPSLVSIQSRCSSYWKYLGTRWLEVFMRSITVNKPFCR